MTLYQNRVCEGRPVIKLHRRLERERVKAEPMKGNHPACHEFRTESEREREKEQTCRTCMYRVFVCPPARLGVCELMHVCQ